MNYNSVSFSYTLIRLRSKLLLLFHPLHPIYIISVCVCVYIVTKIEIGSIQFYSAPRSHLKIIAYFGEMYIFKRLY